MKTSWLEIRLSIPSSAVDLVTDALYDLGSTGITVEERALDTFIPPDPDADLPETFLLKAYFPMSDDIEGLRETIRGRLEDLAPSIPGLRPDLLEINLLRNEDWAEGWKQHFKPFRIGQRLIVKPTWEDVDVADGESVVNIDPGMAFGTGTHATTRLCLEAMAPLFERDPVPTRVLDVGTGSGILAIAAAVLGAKRVLACDIEEESCRTSAENARLNRVENCVEITGEPLHLLERGFDVVLANILAEENIRLADELVGRLAPGGTLVLSGILREKEAAVLDAFGRYGLSEPVVRHRDEWSCILYRNES